VQTRSVECRHRAQSADIVHCKKTFFIIKTLEGHSSFYADIVDRVQTQRAEWVSSADMLHQTHIRGTFCIIKKSEIFFIIYRHFSQSADTACRVGLECRHSSRAPLFACILYMGVHSCRYICILTDIYWVWVYAAILRGVDSISIYMHTHTMYIYLIKCLHDCRQIYNTNTTWVHTHIEHECTAPSLKRKQYSRAHIDMNVHSHAYDACMIPTP